MTSSTQWSLAEWQATGAVCESSRAHRFNLSKGMGGRVPLGAKMEIGRLPPNFQLPAWKEFSSKNKYILRACY